ncbi:MAG: chromate resistance protein [Planctomycetes bacterium]|nr:chromate resistance protein [Planctomycetota bacterium]
MHRRILIITMNKWILLTHQIAQDAPNLRVKVWRHLKKLGAVLFKNAVYLLPYTKEHEESMQWICKQIRDSGSDASLFITESMDKKHNEEIIKTFQESCNKEYLPLIDQCNDVLKQIEQIEGTEGVTDRFVEDFERKLNEIIKSTDEIVKIDFFHAPQRDVLLKKIESIRQKIEKWSKKKKEEVPVINKFYQKKDFLGKKWVTRKDIYIDRIASAWLIRRFIDPNAKFVFISKGENKLPKNAIPFDRYGAEFTHHGDDCTFETLIRVFDLNDPALRPIAEIVHDIDLKDNKYNRKEADGIGQIIMGLSKKLNNDNKLLEKGMEIFDALYQNYSSNYA